MMVQPGMTLPFSNSQPLLKFTAQIGGRKGTVMMNSGAISDFVSDAFITENHIPSTALTSRRTILLADGSTQSIHRQIPSLPPLLTAFTGSVNAHILPLHEYDVILGMPWLTQFNPQIDWQRKTLTFKNNPTTTRPQVTYRRSHDTPSGSCRRRIHRTRPDSPSGCT